MIDSFATNSSQSKTAKYLKIVNDIGTHLGKLVGIFLGLYPPWISEWDTHVLCNGTGYLFASMVLILKLLLCNMYFRYHNFLLICYINLSTDVSTFYSLAFTHLIFLSIFCNFSTWILSSCSRLSWISFSSTFGVQSFFI